MRTVFLLILLAALAGSCLPRRPDLDYAAEFRAQELVACDCFNHDGFPALQWGSAPLWHGEDLFRSNQPITFAEAWQAWEVSPTHRYVLDHGQVFGYAQTSTPTPTGWYYAVLIAEWH